MNTAELNFLQRLSSAFLFRPEALDAYLDSLPVDKAWLPVLRRLLTRKHAYFQRARGMDCSVMSLGMHCLPATVATRWGLKPNLALGEERMPFDLAVHPHEAVADLLRNDFAGYEADGFLPQSNRCVFINKRQGIQFNHDTMKAEDLALPEQRAAHLDAFRETLRTRVETLRARLAGGNCLAVHCISNFIRKQLGHDGFREHIAGIKDYLERHSETNRLMVVVLKTRQDALAWPEEKVSVLDCADPSPEYDWSEPQDYLTDAGFLFEHRIASAILERLESEFPKLSRPRYDDSIYDLHATSKSLQGALKLLQAARNDSPAPAVPNP
ncbi:DUF1796 family putative cysteine peptidase [Pseudodesulfovibrio sp.]|uniref:DUF1796 family putative cysteine peptidase n=1 Tax=Pseudodesulfovibrio sp. TaxID=2035812 RepID=UPI0026312CF9|nr:DUF1796 family putative cysteine peptidase [Pseudodesulfovibrio sp.]MDD3311723.1 DUF1796 family putative cysteine peptidase [Pseudodesulfovibrio sp.]